VQVGRLLRDRLAGFSARSWRIVFVVAVLLPAVLLCVVSWRLIDRLAESELEDRLRTSEAAPWYYEGKMNRALEARAVHLARTIGFDALARPGGPRPRPELFEIFEIDRVAVEAAHAPVALATGTDALLPLTDDDGRPLGTLRYRYTKAGLRTVLHECLDDLRAPWNDDSVEIFLGGPMEGHFEQDFDLHYRVRVNDPVIYEQQARTDDVRFASKITDHGFSVEIAVPWRQVGAPRVGRTFRFDLINNDNDHEGAYGMRDGLTTWVGSERNWADLSGLGFLRIAETASQVGEDEAVALPARASITVDGSLSEPDWSLPNRAQKRHGQTDNVVRWGALRGGSELFIGVDVTDRQIVNHQSHEQVDWVLRITDPSGDILLDTSSDATKVFAQPGAIDVSQTIAIGPLKGKQILFAFRDRPFRRRVERWKVGLTGLLTATSGVLGVGLWLVFANVKRQTDLVALKSLFVATVSHEFKAPLALMRASAEILRKGRATDPEKRTRYEGIIEAEAQRLASLVDNVLRVARIDAGRKYRFEPLDVPRVVEAALGQHRLSLEEGGFAVTATIAPDLPPVVADASAVQEALSILIDNAVKYSRDSRECRIDVRTMNGGIGISVADRGLGVPARDQRKIFDRFYRGENDGYGEKGSGLGLAIARDIARAHGGDMLLESEPGQGSTFTLVLPKEAAR
jgi:signal transduction histidine kinase